MLVIKRLIQLGLTFLLTLSWRRPSSYRNQSMDWFLYDNGLRHYRVKTFCLLRQNLLLLSWCKRTEVLSSTLAYYRGDVTVLSNIFREWNTIIIHYNKPESKSPYSVRIQANMDQKKLRIWIFFMQLRSTILWNYDLANFSSYMYLKSSIYQLSFEKNFFAVILILKIGSKRLISMNCLFVKLLTDENTLHCAKNEVFL